MIFTNLIQTNLRTRRFGKEIEFYQRLGSTNLEAWNLIENNEASHGMIVITDNQFQGKGRNGNSWFMSPSKGLAMSLVMLDPLSLKKAELISIAAGIAIAKALKNRGGKPKLKWPNDILLGNKKCGGILCESRISGQTVNSMVIGIGLNINETENDFKELYDFIDEMQFDRLGVFTYSEEEGTLAEKLDDNVPNELKNES